MRKIRSKSQNRRSDPDTVAEVPRLSDTPACWRGADSLRRLGELASCSKPPLSNRGGTITKDKRKNKYKTADMQRFISL